MRVALLAPALRRISLGHEESWERVVSPLIAGLADRGVQVIRLPTRDTATAAELAAGGPSRSEVNHPLDPAVEMCLEVAEAFERADEFDLIHSHLDLLPLAFSEMTATPLLATIQGPFADRTRAVLAGHDRRVHYVALSDADRRPELHYLATVHPGIDLSRWTLREDPDDHLLFVGPMRPESGAGEAVEIARRAGRPLLLAGEVRDREFFAREVEPHLDGERVRYAGGGTSEGRGALLGGAYALLYPLAFDEAFGLAVVEAMACGTPVVGFRRGGLPEVVAHERTGFLCSTVDEAVGAVARVDELSRSECRRWVEESFSAERMVDRYLELYRRIVRLAAREDHRPWGHYQVLADEADHKVKRIVVQPGQRLSLQRHRQRGEHWYVVEGRAVVTRNDETIELNPGEAVDIPRGAWHRILNPGSARLVFVEVQTGDYFGEDDIERTEDDYGRVV